MFLLRVYLSCRAQSELLFFLKNLIAVYEKKKKKTLLKFLFCPRQTHLLPLK